MGAYCPAPIATRSLMDEITSRVLKPTIDGMRKEGRPYIGVLYAGLLLHNAKNRSTNNNNNQSQLSIHDEYELQVLEFNCRMGDPETQAILMLLETDLLDVLEACVEGRLDSIQVKWKQNCSASTLIQYYTIQYNTRQYYTIQYYTILYYTILYYPLLYYTLLYYTIYPFNMFVVLTSQFLSSYS